LFISFNKVVDSTYQVWKKSTENGAKNRRINKRKENYLCSIHTTALETYNPDAISSLPNRGISTKG